MSRSVLVTGATGFVGRHLCAHFLRGGWKVRGLVREPRSPSLAAAGVEVFRCDLPLEIDSRAFREVDALVHCAYTSRHTSLDEARRVNEEGTAAILGLARDHGVAKFVFVSSTSAHEDALSYYGRSKLAIEKTLDPERDLILRVGLVLGPDGGLFQRLRTALGRSGIVPLFDGGRQPIQTVHIDDLCHTVVRAVEHDRSGRYVVAETEALSMRELFRLIAQSTGRRCFAVPLPTAPLLIVLRLCERLRLPLPISSENLLGARALRFQPSKTDLRELGVRLRSARQSLDDLL